MRRHLPCVFIALAAALAGGGLGCCGRCVRESAGELAEAAVALRVSTSELGASWAAFRFASAPRVGLDERDALAWPEVADEITDALARQREAAIQVERAAAAIADRAGAEVRR